MNTRNLPNIERPLALVDLDDTLFQTARKMREGEERFPVTFDSAGQPNGFMSKTQMMFVSWLMVSADVVPVTARGIDSFQRVDLPFTHGAICSHGGVILSENNVINVHWREQMELELAGIQSELAEVVAQLYCVRDILGLELRITTIESGNFGQFIVVKQKGAHDEVLADVFEELKVRYALGNFYVHRNSNNLAIIPHFISKQAAVREYVYRDRINNGERPILGFGDSLTDLGFMTECHWWGAPRAGQLADFVQEKMA
jgi:hypothetical protein